MGGGGEGEGCPQPQRAYPPPHPSPDSRSTGISTPRLRAWRGSPGGCSTWPAAPCGGTWAPAATPPSPSWPCRPRCAATSSCPSRGSSPEAAGGGRRGRRWLRVPPPSLPPLPRVPPPKRPGVNKGRGGGSRGVSLPAGTGSGDGPCPRAERGWGPRQARPAHSGRGPAPSPCSAWGRGPRAPPSRMRHQGTPSGRGGAAVTHYVRARGPPPPPRRRRCDVALPARGRRRDAVSAGGAPRDAPTPPAPPPPSRGRCATLAGLPAPLAAAAPLPSPPGAGRGSGAARRPLRAGGAGAHRDRGPRGGAEPAGKLPG